jgi:hypothetical protein
VAKVDDMGALLDPVPQRAEAHDQAARIFACRWRQYANDAIPWRRQQNGVGPNRSSAEKK